MSTFILGATGLVGSQIVKAAESSPAIKSITTLTRRTPDFANSSSKLKTLEESDSSKWSEIIKSQAVNSDVYLSAFGTTRAKAGSAENFKKIDYGINYLSAKAAKENGSKVCVLVSSMGANASSPFLYMKTKGELEDDIIKLGFDHTVILRPGALLGERKESHGLGNSIAQTIGNWTKGTWLQGLLKPIDASDVGKVAIDFAQKGINGELKDKVIIVGGDDLVKLANSLN